MLELLYGGWTPIRQPVLAHLQRFKDLQFCTLLNLVDNYTPLTLSVYSVFFKSNVFPQYVQAMKQIRVMYCTLKRRHCDKAPLVWLSMVEYWRATNHPLYTLLQASTQRTSIQWRTFTACSVPARISATQWTISAGKARKIEDKHQLRHFASYSRS